jgi:uncharacterized repeat protein (TIGR03803 family)
MSLVQGLDGNLYGTTPYGQATNSGGTVFTITPGGTLTTIYNFCSKNSQQYPCTDGARPWSGLVLATNGEFYGTASYGGAFGYYGTVFGITSSGKQKVLHSFSSSEGNDPVSGLVQALGGNLYGTTIGSSPEPILGTVYKINLGGAITSLHSFDGVDGCEPIGGLIQATDFNFYGTTLIGGDNAQGTIFKMTPAGAVTRLHSFCRQTGCPDGGYPYGKLV